MSEVNQQPPSVATDPKSFYRVETTGDTGECCNCKQACEMWTVVFESDGEPTEVGQSWGDKEVASDVCDLMNMAYDTGQESKVDNKEEQKLIDFFCSPEGDSIGREGDYDNLTPAETAIRAIRELRRQLNNAINELTVRALNG